jgi:hypothetical protein
VARRPRLPHSIGKLAAEQAADLASETPEETIRTAYDRPYPRVQDKAGKITERQLRTPVFKAFADRMKAGHPLGTPIATLSGQQVASNPLGYLKHLKEYARKNNRSMRWVIDTAISTPGFDPEHPQLARVQRSDLFGEGDVRRKSQAYWKQRVSEKTGKTPRQIADAHKPPRKREATRFRGTKRTPAAWQSHMQMREQLGELGKTETPARKVKTVDQAARERTRSNRLFRLRAYVESGRAPTYLQVDRPRMTKALRILKKFQRRIPAVAAAAMLLPLVLPKEREAA